MSGFFRNILGKISSYNIFNNLYPGFIFCYLLKLIVNIDILTDNWTENIIVFYFAGMIMSRVGSVIIEPLFKKIKLLQYTSYRDYERASKVDELIITLSEVNNIYRTLIACFICLILSKFGYLINQKLVNINCFFLHDNKLPFCSALPVITSQARGWAWWNPILPIRQTDR